MKKTYNKLTCLFGHHDYSDIPTADKCGHHVHLCKICKRSGYNPSFCGYEAWHDYDEEGDRIHTRWSIGHEVWYGYDAGGSCVSKKWSDGEESWRDDDGRWVMTNPKNWKYEKQIQ